MKAMIAQPTSFLIIGSVPRAQYWCHGDEHERSFEQRPVAYAAWQQLNGAIKSGMDLRRFELATWPPLGGCGRANVAWLPEKCWPNDSVSQWPSLPRTTGPRAQTRSTLRCEALSAVK